MSIYADATEKIQILPVEAQHFKPLPVEPITYEPYTKLDGLLLNTVEQREFKLAMIWISISSLLVMSTITVILLLLANFH